MDLQCLRNFSNFLITTEVEMAIWEPCNYVSNLAYDRLLVEMCVQQVWLICFRIHMSQLEIRKHLFSSLLLTFLTLYCDHEMVGKLKT